MALLKRLAPSFTAVLEISLTSMRSIVCKGDVGQCTEEQDPQHGFEGDLVVFGRAGRRKRHETRTDFTDLLAGETGEGDGGKGHLGQSSNKWLVRLGMYSRKRRVGEE